MKKNKEIIFFNKNKMIYHHENTFYNKNFVQEYEIYENSINTSNNYLILCQGFSLSLRYWKKKFYHAATFKFRYSRNSSV